MSFGRILVVDDEPQIRRVLRATLSAQGYEVHDARSGEEALDKLRALRVDLVLLDMNMPGMSGLETCHAIRGSSEVAIPGRGPLLPAAGHLYDLGRVVEA
jgi:two-component system KDP operon response regulator KdpE